MNVFGNALKYTQKGTIVVELALQDPGLEQNEEESPHEKVLVMKVVDTGKGISREYLRTSLFNRKSTFTVDHVISKRRRPVCPDKIQHFVKRIPSQVVPVLGCL